jgi:hypothetical protein
MRFQFRPVESNIKSFKLAPGVRMNLSASGVGWTLGPRGASVGIGKRGTYLNTGIPGTGLSSRTRLVGGSGRKASAVAPRAGTKVTLSVEVTDAGEIRFKDEAGQPVPESVISLAKKQQGDAIRALIQKKCDEINGQIDALGEIHRYTPDHSDRPTFVPVAYGIAPPGEPVRRQPPFYARWFKRWVVKIEVENDRERDKHQNAMVAWSIEKEKFELAQEGRKSLIDRVVSGDVAGMERFLEERLQEIVWPRETNVSFEIVDAGKRIAIDVDLPEREDMPNKSAGVPQRGLRLSIKELSPIQVQKLYMQHIHAVGFRIIGEAFAALPTVEEVILSAYSQRPNRTTGHVEDEYLFSVCVKRAEWARVNFNGLEQIDVVEALSQFELRRQMSKTGVFKGVEPIAL